MNINQDAIVDEFPRWEETGHLDPIPTPVPAGRNTPAARAYTNDRRSGKTHPERREFRKLDLRPRVYPTK